MKNWRFRPMSRYFKNGYMRDTAIVTMEDEWELVCDLSNVWCLFQMTFSDSDPNLVFKGTISIIMPPLATARAD